MRRKVSPAHGSCDFRLGSVPFKFCVRALHKGYCRLLISLTCAAACWAMRVITVQKPSTASAAVRNVSQRLESSADKRAVEIVQCEDNVKRTARYRDSPLENDELLAAIFQAVGKREHMFAAAVSKHWSSCYLSKDSEYSCNTSYRSVLATDSRLQYALSAGLTVEHVQNWCKTLERDVCSSLEPIAVLQLLRARGLKWTSELCVEAVCSNDLELLQWLYTAGCLWRERRLVVTKSQSSRAVPSSMLCSSRHSSRLVERQASEKARGPRSSSWQRCCCSVLLPTRRAVASELCTCSTRQQGVLVTSSCAVRSKLRCWLA
jgi:hypothetical protein